MLNSDLLLSAKNLLDNLKALREETDSLNVAFMNAMDQDDKVSAVRDMFPAILAASDKSAAVIAEAFLSVDWEKEGNDPQVLYSILGGKTDVPDDLKNLVEDFLSSLNGTEKEMEVRFGPDPIMSAIRAVGLEEEFLNLVSSRDEIVALSAALQQTPGLPLALPE